MRMMRSGSARNGIVMNSARAMSSGDKIVLDRNDSESIPYLSTINSELNKMMP
jgi:hypothetical protein